MSEKNLFQQQAEQSINAFVDAARAAFESDLAAAVLFGSAAEGRLRATSDVNLMLVLHRFDQSHADRLREPMRLAHAAVQMHVMFILESEMAAAAEAFAVKFADIRSRRRVLFGSDPFADLDLPRDALVRIIKQVLLNLQLRMRERYVLVSLREEQLMHVIADAAAPLRSSAASLLQLEGRPAASPKAALEQIALELEDSRYVAALQQVSMAREEGRLPPGSAVPTLMTLMQLTQHLRERAECLQ